MDTKYLRDVLLFVLSCAISVFFIAYIVYHLSGSGASAVTTVTATGVTAERTIDADAYIMRSEHILYSRVEGSVLCSLPDGERAPAGSQIASVYASNDTISSKITEINNEILILEKSNENAGYSVGTSTIDNAISLAYGSLLSSSTIGDSFSSENSMRNLLVALNRKRIAIGAVSNYSSIIATLKSRRATLLAKMGDTKDTVTTPVSGNFYSEVDGYEHIFAASLAETMKYDSFETMTSSDPDMSIIDSAAGHAVGKVVTDSYWYICCKIGIQEMRLFSRGKSYDVTFKYNNDTVISMRLDRIISAPSKDGAILIFGSRTTPENFDFRRVQAVSVNCGFCTGYKVPVSAVRYVNDTVGVYILDVNRVAYRTVNILYETDGYYIAAENTGSTTALGMYDDIITSGKELYSGKYID